MSIYFDKKLPTSFGDVCLDIVWQKDARLAAACTSSSDGSYIAVYDTQGSLVDKVSPVGVRGNITALAWHPRASLAAAWGSSLITCCEGEAPILIDSPHRSSIRLLMFSQQGNRLISADAEGGLVGWNAGAKQLLTGFHHQLNDQISHAVFRTPNQQGLDLQNVARAAVAGDADALDLFTNLDMFGWRPKTAGRRPMVYPAEFRDGMAFFAATSSGMLLYLSENGRCQEVLDLDCACRDMLFRAEKDQLLILTEILAVLQLGVLPDGSVEELMKVKLTGDIREVAPSMVWARCGTIAVNLGGQSVRLWALDTGDNAVLSLPEDAITAEHFTALSASSSGILCGATNSGRILMWRLNADDWVQCGTANMASPVKCLSWGQQQLAVCTLTGLHLLQEHPLTSAYKNKTGCIQKTGNSVIVRQEDLHVEIKTDIQIRGLAVSANYISLYDEKSVLVYQITTTNKQTIAHQNLGTFTCECEAMAIYEETLIVMEIERVTMRTIQGTVKQILLILPTEGMPIVMSCFNQYVSVITNEGVLRMWDINRREAKSFGQVKNLRDLIEDYGEAMVVSSNCDGSRVGVLVADVTLTPTNCLHVLDTDGDLSFSLNFLTGVSTVKGTENCTQDISDRMILNFCWDEEDPKLLVVETKCSFNSETENNAQVVCLWVSPEKGILLHEKIALKRQNHHMVGCAAPHIMLASPDNAAGIEIQPMGDFVGVAYLDPITRSSVLKFSYHLATGELDLAFQAIHSVTSEAVWENLARSCVKSKRLDVAEVCMGRVGNAHAARALRLATSEPELDARVAILAMHLGMLDEAKSLLIQCKRYDLLNKLYQCMGDWDQAIKVAEVHDRVRLRTTVHQKARYMEQIGEMSSALKLYEAADTHRVHAPRLLADDPARLTAYVDKSADPTMLKWVAQLLESQGDMQGALQYYTRAHDVCAIVRVLCFLGDLHKAGEVVSSTGDRAAAYHLARQFEALGRLDDALVFYTRAHAFGNAIRICKEQGAVDKIWNLALQGNSREQIEAARLLLDAGDTHKAILLLQQAGEHREAVELAISYGDLEALDAISRDGAADVDPSLIASLAETYIRNQQYDKAVDLLSSAGKISEAISICTEHSVSLTEELADKLNPVGPDRNKLLIEIGNCALAQGSYHLATKKFTQAGDKERAMKALLKSGDTEKIIFLAGVSREKEVYIMAANYLQALDWRSDPQLLNTIIQFYSKARAHQALSSFYMACANVEVEEFDDLEKAVVALAEAKRCLSRGGDDVMSRRAADTIERRTGILHQLIKARRSFEAGDSVEASSICRQILAVNDPDGPVSKGKVLGLMLVHEKDKLNARKLYEELRSLGSNPNKFVPHSILESLGLITIQPDTDNED